MISEPREYVAAAEGESPYFSVFEADFDHREGCRYGEH
jgi:hypothetical protein